MQKKIKRVIPLYHIKVKNKTASEKSEAVQFNSMRTSYYYSSTIGISSEGVVVGPDKLKLFKYSISLETVSCPT